MEDYSRERRGLFEGLKVPFCLNALLLAFIGVWIFRLGNFLLFKALAGPTEAYAKWGIIMPIWEFIENLAWWKPGPGITTSVFSCQNLLYAIWFVIAWAFFSGAIARIMAMRIARDETIELKNAVAFAVKRFGTHIFAVLFIVIAMIFFYMCCMLAGVMGRIPHVGPIILIFVYILVFAAILIVTLLAVGLVFGFNLISASIASDGVDTFDAISRAYSYVFSRPWQILLYTVLPFAFLIIFFAFANGIFLNRTLGAVGIGMGPKWGGEYEQPGPYGTPQKFIVGPRAFIEDVDKWEITKQLSKPWQDKEGKNFTDKDYEDMKKELEQMYDDLDNQYEQLAKLDDEYKDKDKGDPNVLLAKARDKDQINNEIKQMKNAIALKKWGIYGKPTATIYLLAIVVKIMYFIAFYLIIAYVVAYWIGSQTVAYFLLRKDVDGDRLEEVYLDEGEEEDAYFSFEKLGKDEKKEEAGKKEEKKKKKKEDKEKEKKGEKKKEEESKEEPEEEEKEDKAKKKSVRKKGGRASKRKKKED
ncbi:MAG: hypothetical protein E3J72_06830 [Planctomycetota bacterium]|nr:MAG: hypothetical protein E3J72_06830 [Planctomycetota bacterium]